MAYYYSPFRRQYGPRESKGAGGCPFCDPEALAVQAIVSSSGELVENEHYRWIINLYPKFEGHTMVVPKRHILSLDDETPEEALARYELTKMAARTLCAAYPGAGIEVFIQTGPGSESSVPHLHWHVVPSLPDDHLRGFDKLGHFFTIEPGKERVIVFPVPIRLAREELIRALRAVL